MKHLTWFQQSFQERDIVRYNISTEREGRSPIGDDFTVKNTDLQARAEARGVSTWDESDILAHHAEVNGETATLFALPEEPVDGE